MKVIIAAAGTGGHINPGLAIANKIKEKEPDSEIIFIGTPRGLENDLVPRAGYGLKTIEAYGLSKQISIANFKKICATLSATGKTRKIIQEFKPDIIVGAGGYICGPVVWAAKKENIPISVCGEMASKSDTAMILAGMGIRNLSMGARRISCIKEVLANISIKELQAISSKSLNNL